MADSQLLTPMPLGGGLRKELKKFRPKLPEDCNRKYCSDSEACDYSDYEVDEEVLPNAMKKISKLPQVSSDSEETPLSASAVKKNPKLPGEVFCYYSDLKIKKTSELTLEVKNISKLPQDYSIFYDSVERRPEQKCCNCVLEDGQVCEFCLFSGSDDDNDDYNDNIFEGYPARLLKQDRPYVDRLQERYAQQIRQSYGFEIDDYPGGAVPIVPLPKFKEHPDFGLMVKLANRAIQEYNEEECNVDKYEIIKIETANYMLSGYEQYFLTVKVLNLTIGALIETFYIRVARRIPDGFEEILSCGRKGVEPEFSIYGKKN